MKIQIVDGIISRDSTTLPLKNYHLSLAKMIMDQFEIFAADIDYGTTYLNVMETTRFLSRPDLARRDTQVDFKFCIVCKNHYD